MKKIMKGLMLFAMLLSSVSLASCDLSGILNPEQEQVIIPEKKTEFALTLHINNETIVKTVNKENPINLSEYVPELVDMTFEGWFLDSNYTEKFEGGVIDTENQILNIYAKIVPSETLILTVIDEGLEERHVIARDANVSLSAYIKTKEGFTFNGWYTDFNFETKVSKESFKMTSSMTVYAKYDALDVYAVNLYIGEVFSTYEVYNGVAINLSNFITPEEDEILAGWYYDANYTKKANNRLVVKSNLTLYIDCYKREDITYAVYGIGNDVILTPSYINAYISLGDIDTTKENFIFEGWYYDEAHTERVENYSSIKLTENFSFYANYVENPKCQLYITLPTVEGEYEEVSYGVYYLDKIIDLKSFELSTNPDYHFEGLYLEPTFKTKVELKNYKVTELVGVSSVFRLYAKYTCSLNVYVNDDLVLAEEKIYGADIDPFDYISTCGESYRFESILTKENFIMDRTREIKLTGYSYVDCFLSSTFEHESVEGGISITGYTGDNPIVFVPSTINNKPVIRISANAFPNSVVSVTIPETVTSVDSKAFTNCKKLIEVYNLSSVVLNIKTVGTQNLYTSADSESKLSFYDKEFIIYDDGVDKYLVAYAGIKPKLTLPTTINGESYKLYNYALANNQYINTLVVPEGITELSSYLCADNNNLIRVRIPSSLTNIGVLAFSNCFNLIEIYNDSTLNIVKDTPDYGGIAQYALYVYEKNTEYSDKLSLMFEEAIYENQTYEIGYLVYIDNNTQYLLGISKSDSPLDFIALPSTINDDFYEIFHHAFYGTSTVLSITIPSGVKVIGDSAFENCYSIKEVNLGYVDSIGDYAFANCYRISKIDIPSCVKTIGGHAFYNCTNAIGIQMCEGVETIGDYAFSNCTSISELVIPNSVTQMGEKVLFGCSKLATLTLPFVGKTRTDNVYYYFGYIFGGITQETGNINLSVPTSLKKVVITDDEILESQAFWRCTAINEIEFKKTTTLKTSTFGYCTSLKTLTFSDDILFKDISEDSFYQCNLLYFKTNYWTDFMESNVMKSLFTTKTALRTYDEYYSGTLKLLTYEINTSYAFNSHGDLASDFEIILTDGTVITKSQIDELIALEADKTTQSVVYSYTSNIQTTTSNGFKHYKEGDYVVTLSLTINGVNYKIESDILHVIK